MFEAACLCGLLQCAKLGMQALSSTRQMTAGVWAEACTATHSVTLPHMCAGCCGTTRAAASHQEGAVAAVPTIKGGLSRMDMLHMSVTCAIHIAQPSCRTKS